MRADAAADLEATGRQRRPSQRHRVLREGPRRWRVGTGLVVLVGMTALATVLDAGKAGLVNAGGWSLARQFWAAAGSPEMDPAFVDVALQATVTTLGHAVLGTAGSIVIGLIGAVLLSETWWRREAVGTDRMSARPGSLRPGWLINRAVWAIPRGIHEAVWGIALIAVLGRDPLVAVLAIAIPFGAITAKVYAELVDEHHAEPYELLRSGGAGRVVALAYGVVPVVARDLVSYGFYRFECSIRSSVVLGMVGAGGLGYELMLSFRSLQYEQMWTLVYFIVALSAMGEGWSALLRGTPTPGRFRWSLVAAAVMAVGSALQVGVDPRTAWSARTRELAVDLLSRFWPPRLPEGGLGRLVGDAVETLHMSIVASMIATGLAMLLAFAAARRSHSGPIRAALGWVSRSILLVCRAIPAPVWALVLLLVLLPGGLPGAAALGLYNFGILGRLLAEVVENHDPAPARALEGLGAPTVVVFAQGVMPQVAPRFAAYALYRWEVTTRETVVVGVVGAGGLGHLLAEQSAAFDHGGMLATVGVLVALTLLVDLVSSRIRAGFR